MRRRDGASLEAELPRLRRFARSLARDRAEADDLVQETLLRALSRLDDLRDVDRLGAWLAQIMVNLHRSRRRDAARRRALLESRPPPVDQEPARQEGKLELDQTLAALARLPEEQREAVALVSLGGLGYAEAAEALGVRLGTLMSRVSRGRAALRAEMEGAATRHCGERERERERGR